MYKVCKSYEVESGHMLSKHKGACRFPHGHSRVIEVVVSSEKLDENDMVCDFSVLKKAIVGCCEKYDHSMCMNVDDPSYPRFKSLYEHRVVPFYGDPTTEFMAKIIYAHISNIMPDSVKLEKVRVSETSSTWAEYSD